MPDGITDLTRRQANAARLLQLSRGHWRIENGVFYVRDEAFGEGRCRVRKQSGPQVLAALRNAALSLLRLAGSNISPQQLTQLHLESSARPEALKYCEIGRGRDISTQCQYLFFSSETLLASNRGSIVEKHGPSDSDCHGLIFRSKRIGVTMTSPKPAIRFVL